MKHQGDLHNLQYEKDNVLLCLLLYQYKKKLLISRKSMLCPAESWFADADLVPLWIRSDEGQRTVSLTCIYICV